MLRGAGEDESARPGAQVKFGLDRIEDDGVVAQVIQGDVQDPALPQRELWTVHRLTYGE